MIHECRGYTTGTYNQAVELRPRAITNDMGQGAKAGEPGTWEPGAFSGRTQQGKMANSHDTYLLAGGFADLTVVPKDGFNDLQSGRLLNRRTRRFSPDYSSPHLDFDLAKAAANAGNINGWLAERVSTTRAFTPDGARKRCWESWVWAFC